MLGLDAAKDVGIGQPNTQVLVAESAELGTGDDRAVDLQTGLPGHRDRRGRVVAGHHHHTDAGSPAISDGLRHVEPHRIFQTEQAQKLEAEIVLLAGQHIALEAGPGHAEHPQALAGHRGDLACDPGAGVGIEMAEVGDRLGRALGSDQVLARIDQVLG